MKSIVLTGGGTAGHVTPNLALIPHLQKEGYQIHYFGTKAGIERTLVEQVPGVTYHAIRSGKLRRYFSWQNAIDPFRVIAGYFDAGKALKKIRPAAVFSKGGFVSVPVVIAGRRHKIPVILHESDYTPGLANKIAISFADKVLVTFEDTLAYTKHKGIFTGTPIRPELFSGDARKGLAFVNLSGKKPILLAMGGSQGALAINEALREALPKLLQTFDVVHLCGRGKLSPKHQNIAGYRQFEYVNEQMPDIFSASNIVISRAGANSVFEFLALSIPSLLIPLPLSASRGDQIQNAAYMEKKGYAIVLKQEELEKKSLIKMVNSLYENCDHYIQNMRQAKNTNGTQAVLREIQMTITHSQSTK